jgi:hypothetical protein
VVTGCGGLLGVVIDHDMRIFHAVDEYANAQGGGKEGTEQEEAVCGLSPGEKKQKRDGHQQFGVHGVFMHPFRFSPRCYSLPIGPFFQILTPFSQN